MVSRPAVTVCQVAVAVPLHRQFDYLWPFAEPPTPGQLVRVPFGSRQLFGLVVGCAAGAMDAAQLKPVSHRFAHCTLPDDLLALTRWCASYYHHPLGEVASTVLPAAMHRPPAAEVHWQITAAGRQALNGDKRLGGRQQQALTGLSAAAQSATALRAAGISSAVLTRLAQRGWIQHGAAPAPAAALPPVAQGLILMPDQQVAVDEISGALGSFGTFLLHGITGSGKTEVYLALIEKMIAQGAQALVIVPEIGLTPQLLQRFERRLGPAVGVLHSQMPESQRAATWQRARAGQIGVVLGTRSAVFCPLPHAALIVVDEEHDLSFKQQDGFRYSARDVAVQRARMLHIPVILGSATPSLESLANSDRGRYRYLRLASRPGVARLPTLRLVDIRGEQSGHGLAPPTIAAITEHLQRGEQVLVFLNRRGFAPVVLCNACGWSADCPRCDTRMTLHQSAARLRCHHCGTARRVPDSCPACGSTRLLPLGAGTQRLEQFLNAQFADFPVWRIDRDSVRGTGTLNQLLAQVTVGNAGLLVGTQMLAKGHDFPRVTLVVVANIDQALYSSDFRSTERTAQLLVQVAGRAGRSSDGGQVLIQTHHPDHPLFSRVLANGYLSYARELMAERRAAVYPPYGYMALVRAEAHQSRAAEEFLAEALAAAPASNEVELLGPLPSPMPRRAGRHRWQLLVNCSHRRPLHQLLTDWLPALGRLRSARSVRWSVDIDPQDMF